MIVTSAVKEDRSQCDRKTAGSDCRFAVKGDREWSAEQLPACYTGSASYGVNVIFVIAFICTMYRFRVIRG